MRGCIGIAEFRVFDMQKCMDWRAINFDWNQARAFLVTAEEGSYSAAARALGVAQPTIGRQVSALEQELGVTLFERVGRGLELTAAGMELAEQVRAMGEAAMRISLSAAGQSTSLEGVVSITASEVISAYLLPPAVAAIRAEHPGIELELAVGNDVRDLRRREADIAVRNFRPKDPELFATRLPDSCALLYAAPSYLERLGSPTRVEDLADIEIFAFDRTPMMVQGLARMGLQVSEKNFPIVTSNHLVQWEMAKAGLGACIIMREVGDAEPAVQCLLPDQIQGFPVEMWLTAHRELRTSRRIRVVFDMLREELSAERAGRP